MRAARMFLNEGEKENKRGGGGERDRTTCVEEKNEKKRNEAYGWNEMRERRNNIKNKKNPNWEILPQYFHNKF